MPSFVDEIGPPVPEKKIFAKLSIVFGTKDSYTNLKLLVSQEKLYLGLKIIYLIGDNV